MTQTGAFELVVSIRGTTSTFAIPHADPTLGTLLAALQAQLGLAPETVKLLLPGIRGAVALSQRPTQRASEAGLKSGVRVMLLGSREEDVAAVRSANDLPAMRGFEEELVLAATRRPRRDATHVPAAPPSGEFTFGDYEPWRRPGLYPPPEQALQLLHRLAADPGIRGVMADRRYAVGRLTEMPPEGRVGVSPVCVLGVNINAGQEISLRLRTDDLRGFRKYERIRETLLHELAHMEHGDHDAAFKALNSELNKQCAAINARYTGGRSLLGDGLFGADADAERMRPSELDGVQLATPADVMAATRRQSGRTLRQLAAEDAPRAADGASGNGIGVGAHSRINISAAAAVLPQGVRLAAGAAASPVGGLAAHVTAGRESGDGGAGGRGSPGGGSGSDAEGAGGCGTDPSRFEHYDAATAAAEEAARRLGEPAPSDAGEAGHGASDRQGGAAGEAAGTPVPLAREHNGMEVDAHAAAPATSPELRQQQEPPAVRGTASSSAAAEVPVAAAASAAVAPDPDVRMEDARAPAADDDAGVPATVAGAVPGHAAAEARAAPQPDAAVPAHPAPPPLPRPPLTLTPPTELSAAAAAAGGDDLATAKAAAAWAALGRLVAASHSQHAHAPHVPAAAVAAGNAATGEEVLAALDTLQTLLGNAAAAPGDERYRRVRLGNATFVRRVGRLAGGAGVDVLRQAGFVQEGEGLGRAVGGGGAAEESVLRLRRNDPGLLWLVLSAVRDAREQVASQLGPGPHA